MADSQEIGTNQCQHIAKIDTQSPSSQLGHESTQQSDLEKEFQTQNDVIESEAKKAKRVTSDVWNFFTSEGISSDGKPRVKCKGCGVSYVGGGTKYGTSTLSRHMLKCDGIRRLKQTHLPPIILDLQTKLRSSKLDQKNF